MFLFPLKTTLRLFLQISSNRQIKIRICSFMELLENLKVQHFDLLNN